jgi:hypothetical protein
MQFSGKLVAAALNILSLFGCLTFVAAKDARRIKCFFFFSDWRRSRFAKNVFCR